MAYNPFNIFRRNQKALFAVLTVFIMIMFTLQSGVVGTDPFEWFGRWAGGRKGETVCKIDGSTIKSSDLDRVRRSRVMANTFMAQAAAQTAEEVRSIANQQQGRLGDEGRQLVQTVSLFESMLMRDRAQLDARTQQLILQQMQSAINAVMISPTAKSEDKEVARAYQAMLVLASHRGGSEGDHYFLNAPNRTNRDTIEFLLWEKKADQLGIRFTADDVKVLLNREMHNYWTAKSDVEVAKRMRGREGFNINACMAALATEFKVRAAQVAVMGPVARSRPSAGPVFGAPYEEFEYYRQQCSPATYEVLPVPAQAFADKVTGDPTEAELNDLYKKYANEEPNPGKESFGFMDPRKLSLAWLAITGNEPYYEKLAAEQVKVGEVMAKAGGLTAVPLPGGGGWAAAAVAPLTLKEPAVDAAYSAYKNDFEARLHVTAYDRANITARELLPTSVVRPAALAAALGGMVGQTAPFGSPAVAASLAVGPPIGYEIRDRVKTGLPLFLGAVPGPAAFQTAVAGAASYTASEPKPLPIEAMRPELLKTTVTKRAKELAFGVQSNFMNPTASTEKGDLAKFIEELEKLSEKGKPKDKAAIEKYITEFRTARGLTKPDEQFGASTAPRDEWTLEEDRGLQPLVFAQKEALMGARGAHGGNQYMPFGRGFFWTQSPDMSTGGMRRQPTTGLYLAKPYPAQERSAFGDEGRPRYVVWATDDIPAKKMSTITAKDTVRAAWKQMKAREMAKTRAEALAAAIGNSPASSPETIRQTLSDEAGKFRSEISVGNSKAYFRAQSFTLDNVCPFVPVDISRFSIEELRMMSEQRSSPFGRVEPFRLTESANIPYPNQEMLNALLDNRDKPAKTVLVLPDAPKDTYYVAVLLKRDLRTPEEFKRSVYGPTAPAAGILRGFDDDAARRSHQSVVELLKKEFKYVETDEQKKKLDDNAKSGGRD